MLYSTRYSNNAPHTPEAAAANADDELASALHRLAYPAGVDGVWDALDVVNAWENASDDARARHAGDMLCQLRLFHEIGEAAMNRHSHPSAGAVANLMDTAQRILLIYESLLMSDERRIQVVDFWVDDTLTTFRWARNL